ncbi:MAG: hypothetical protein IJ094_06080 [Bacilli bacterium]|nr:hypothetical protein [Bacilli bacterium]
MKNVYMFNEKDDFITYYNNIDEVIKKIIDNKISSFNIMENNNYNTILTEGMYYCSIKSKQEDANYVFFDSDHEAFSDIFGEIYFTKEFYTKYKEKIDKEIINNLFNKKNIFVNKEIYTENLAQMLCLNAEKIEFAKGIHLPEYIIKLYNDNRIHAHIQGEFKIVSDDNILGLGYNIINSDTTTIELEPDIKDYKNLKKIPSFKIIYMDYNSKYDDNILKIIKTMNYNNQENKIIINISDRYEFIKSNLFKSNYDFYIFNKSSNEEYSHMDMKEEEKIYDNIINDINAKNYSPYEKYLICYNVTKKFKKYKENDGDKDQARNLRHVFNNEYMVCVGYVNVLKELLKRVGIESYDYGLGVDTSYDKGFSIIDEPTKYAGHERLIVNINDPKYGINGFYVADPTWDNDLENDYYNYATMSFNKTEKEDRYMFLTDEDLIMNVKNMEEFSERINYYVNKEIKRRYKLCKIFNFKDELYSVYQDINFKILSILKDLSYNNYKEIYDKYKKITEYHEIAPTDYTNLYNLCNDFLTDAGNIFIEKLGKDVIIDTVIDAACEVNKEVYNFNDGQLESYKEELLEMNKLRDRKAFPYYYNDGIIK